MSYKNYDSHYPSPYCIFSYIARLHKKRLSGEEHDPLFIRCISKMTKVSVIICGLILALQTLGLTGVAGEFLAGAGIYLLSYLV